MRRVNHDFAAVGHSRRLYAPFAAVHGSSYIAGMTARTRSCGLSTPIVPPRRRRRRLLPRWVRIAAEHARHAVVGDDDGQQRQRRPL